MLKLALQDRVLLMVLVFVGGGSGSDVRGKQNSEMHGPEDNEMSEDTITNVFFKLGANHGLLADELDV